MRSSSPTANKNKLTMVAAAATPSSSLAVPTATAAGGAGGAGAAGGAAGGGVRIPSLIPEDDTKSIAASSMHSAVIDNYGSDAAEIAATRLAALLSHPDDLNGKLAALRKKIQSEKGSVDAQLKTTVQSQLDDAQHGLNLLKGSSDAIIGMRNNLGTVDSLCLQAQDMIQHYPFIKQLSRTHRNFVAVKELVGRFQQLNKHLDRITALLNTDARDILGDADNLLFIHHQLHKLNEFRDQAYEQARGGDPLIIQSLPHYFIKLDSLQLAFEDYLWSLTRNILQLIQHNQGSVVVRLLKVVEAEEARDARMLALKERLAASSSSAAATAAANNNNNNNNNNKAAANKGKSGAADPKKNASTAAAAAATAATNSDDADLLGPFVLPKSGPIIHPPKKYREQLFNSLSDMIESHFEGMLGPLSSNITESLTTMHRLVFDDLQLVFDDLVPRFPVWKPDIFQFFLLEYHRHVYSVLKVFTANPSKLEAGDILLIVLWVHEYYEIMEGRFSIVDTLLQPPLLDDREQELYNVYVRIVRAKLIEWVNNLVSSEAREFVARENPPDVDKDKHYASPSPTFLFQMINQQIKMVQECSRGKLLFDVACECVHILFEYQRGFLRVLDQEATKCLQSPPSPDDGALLCYVSMLANDCFQCTEHVDSLIKELEEELEDKEMFKKLEVTLNAALDGFQYVSRTSHTVLMEIMFRDLKPYLVKFYTQDWYDEDLMGTVVLTIDDYLGDLNGGLCDYVFSKLVSDLMDRLLIHMVDAMRGSKAFFRFPDCTNKLKADIQAAIAMFSKYRSPKRVNVTFEFIEKFSSLVLASMKMAYVEFFQLWKLYNDIPLPLIEEIFFKRRDMDRSLVKEFMEMCTKKVKEGGNADAQASLFSRLGEATRPFRVPQLPQAIESLDLAANPR